jgi:hypothetical protein
MKTIVADTIVCVLRRSILNKRAHRESSKQQHTRGTARAAVDASDLVTKKTVLALRKNKMHGPGCNNV